MNLNNNSHNPHMFQLVDYNILHDGCNKGSKGYKMAELAKRRYGHGQRKVPKASD